MLILCVSECTKKSLPKTRRILSKYLSHIGRRTWIGNLSEEGTQDLHNLLIKNSSKKTSITCYQIGKYNDKKICFHVGNKIHFNENGEYSYSITKMHQEVELYFKSEEEQFFLSILKLSALFHDLGKSTVGFQEKLNNALSKNGNYKIKKDVVRHELVSCLIIYGIIKNNMDDNIIFQHLSTEENVHKCFSENSDNYLNIIKSSLNKYCKTAIRDPWPQFSNFLLSNSNQSKVIEYILWLVLTHHKLPEAKDLRVCSGVKNFWRAEFVDSSKILEKELLEEFLNFLTLKEGKKPWDNTGTQSWCASVAKECRFIAKYLQNNLNNKSFIETYVPNYLRPLLIISDYMGSEKKEKFLGDSLSLNSTIFANTILQSDEKYYADTLDVHLNKVAHYTKVYFNCIFLNSEAFSAAMPLKSKKPDNERFLWQHEVYQKIDQLKKENASAQVFCVLTSSTGSGKTRAIALACSAAAQDHKLRYSLGLGLRTLTLQTGSEYKKLYDESDVAVVVGDRLTREIWESQAEHNDLMYDPQDGSSNSPQLLAELDDANFIIGGKSNNKSIPFLNKTQEVILSTPIVVATIDHLISGAEIKRGSESFMALRLMTSDLAIDEIDSFAASDLVSIGRLVYLTGFYGRNVVLSSASVQNIIVQKLYEAFLDGVKDRNLKNNKEQNIIVCLGSNYSSCSSAKLMPINNNDEFNKYYNEFLLNHCNYLKKSPEKHYAEFIEVKDKKNFEEENFNIVLNAAERMHLRHSYMVKNNSFRFSIGFVRWNRTHICRDFAKWLMDEEKSKSELKIAVFCYHSYLNFVDRRRVESFLDKGLKRSENCNDPEILLNCPEFQKWYEQNDFPKNVMMLVSTTSIQETGRDHDYDWTILDPCSTRSIVQASGRVLRHRPQCLPTGPNIGILRFSSQTWFESHGKKEKPNSWAYPGVETDAKLGVFSHFGWRALRKADYPKKDNIDYEVYRKVEEQLLNAGIELEIKKDTVITRIRDAEKAIFAEVVKKIDSSFCLLELKNYLDSPLTAVELIELREHLLKNFKNKYSLEEFIKNKKHRLTQHFFLKTRFRNNNFAIEDEYFPAYLNEKKWDRWLLKTKSNLPTHNNDFAVSMSIIEHNNVLKSKRNFFIDYNLNLELKEIKKLLPKETFDNHDLKNLASIKIPYYWQDKKFNYHPILGLGIRET
jgi:CRISPR-associated endonuclease/helicase Cas3